MFQKLTRKLGLAVALLCIVLPLSAQQAHRQLTRITDYLLYLPQEYEADTAKQWPLIMCLHGAAEDKQRCGQGIEIVRKIGYAKYIEENDRQHPCIVVSPQADGGWDPEILYEVLQEVREQYRVDPDRIYLTGLSMGGQGTWRFAQAYPHLFAAIAPICAPGIDTTHIWALSRMPIWVNHGNKDTDVDISYSDTMVKALRDHGSDVKYSIWEGANHHIYFPLYEGDELRDWLLSHTRRPFHAETAWPARELLESYAGKYSHPEQNYWSVTLVMNEQGRLVAEDGRPALIPISHNSFFYDPHMPEHLEFKQNPTAGKMEILVHVPNEQTFVLVKQE